MYAHAMMNRNCGADQLLLFSCSIFPHRFIAIIHGGTPGPRLWRMCAATRAAVPRDKTGTLGANYIPIKHAITESQDCIMQLPLVCK